ncbi:DNA repair protein RecO [uncultured Eudoraea sp.]|uniref:DNA repair protein RecO n=1 Tax=uncultured Eudoraea sp. TaxID=1035614 RepID=UPI00262C7538|nr:DNA repair protein RecO [uncultured Eudoraea sp.]
MQITTKALILSSLKYGDTSLIVKAFTYSDGLKSYLLKGVLASKKGKLKAAYFQPLTQLEIVVHHKNKGSLERLIDAKVSYPYQSVHSEMAKNAMILFLAEILLNSIFEEEQNKELFNFLEASLQWLDTHDSISNFHLFFLLGLSKYLGFYPDTTNIGYPYFDLVEGEFIESPGINPILKGDMLETFKEFLGTNFDAIHMIRVGNKTRQELLQSLVLYFEVHLHGFKKPRSLAILNEVFS